MKRQFYQQFTAAQKRDMKKRIMEICMLRKKQVAHIDEMLCEPLRDAANAGQLFLKNELSLQEYFAIEDAADVVVLRFFKEVGK